jgi:type IV pilus assembly protein PilC
MFGSAKISTRQLIRLSRQMAVSLNAGIDIRSAWAREVERASGWAMRARYRTILEAVKGGESVSAALAATDDYFPPLFREILAMGEESGHLGEAFAQLADHYETRARMANALLAAMIWPGIELSFALVMVAALIYVPKALTNSDIDILGLGLVGAKGVQIYAMFLLMVAAGIGALVYAMRRGVFWVRPIQKAMLFVPAIGNVLRTLALARIAWSLQLTFNTSMSVRRALRLSLNSAQNPYYTELFDPIHQAIASGETVYEAFLGTGVFPADFLDTLQVGEESGQIVETMARLSKLYQAKASAAMTALAVIGGFLIWLLVAAILVVLIFRVAFFYLNTINNAVNGKF